MQRASETLQCCRVAQVGIAECRTHEMCGVCGDISTLVVTMECDIQPHILLQTVVIAIAKHVHVVPLVQPREHQETEVKHIVYRRHPYPYL